jgi:hypothetical protein
VLDPDGAGVGGARVTLLAEPASEVVAEADGSFVFERLPVRTYAVTAIAGELIAAPVVVRLAEDAGPVVVRLVRGAALAVQVVDARGAPVPGATVALVDASARTATTDEAGRARLAPLRAGPVGVAVSAAGYATTSTLAAPIAPGAIGTLTIALPPGYSISGRVIDAAGRLIAGAEVLVADGLGGAGTGGARLQTDVTGAFTMPGLGTGEHTLLVSDGEHAPATSPPIEIRDRSVAGVEIAMSAGAAIAGAVVTADHAPVASATIRLVGGGGPGTRTVYRELTSDAQGRFEVRGLPPMRLHAQAESNRATSDTVEVDLAGGAMARELTLLLDAGGQISGVVVDPAGHALAEVEVTAYREGAATVASTISSPARAISDGGGAFAFTGLRAGTYRLVATSELPGLRNADPRGASATTGASDVRIALVARDPAGGALPAPSPAPPARP